MNTPDIFPQIVAKTFQGLEQVLADELNQLGAKDIEIKKRAVIFSGDLRLLYKVNLWSRTAISFLLPIAEFEAGSDDQLYKECLDLPWEKLIGTDQTFLLSQSIHSTYFKHSQYALLKVKDAIVDRIRKEKGKRPSVNTDSPDIRINVNIQEKKVVLSLDSSGEALFKRGYRMRAAEAPINEVLAAGILALAGYKGTQVLLDPMCGAGTFPIEAAMIATNTAPGLIRKVYGFQTWKNYDEKMWRDLFAEARDKKRTAAHPIIGSDILDVNIDKARKNATQIRCDQLKWKTADFFDLKGDDFGKGILVMNPPYDERLGLDDAVKFYKTIGDHFKSHFPCWDAWVISSHMEALKMLGLRPTGKHTLFNGPLECKLQHYSLYEGSKKSGEN